jgi:hypothetical protein
MKRIIMIILGILFLSGCAKSAGTGGGAYTTRAKFISELIKASSIEIKYFREPKATEYFDDVKDDSPYAMSLINAVDSGIITPVNRKIGPDERIKLSEVRDLLWKAYMFKAKNGGNISDEVINEYKRLEGDKNLKDEDFITTKMEQKIISIYKEKIKTHLNKSEGSLKNPEGSITEEGIRATTTKQNAELIITLDWGEKPTGGYVLRILGVKEIGDTLEVEYLAKAPGPNDIVTQAITYPKDSMKIKVSDINKEYKIVLKAQK